MELLLIFIEQWRQQLTQLFSSLEQQLFPFLEQLFSLQQPISYQLQLYL